MTTLQDSTPTPRGAALVDSFGRVHTDLRISLTDRCSLRCTYCMPEQGNTWLTRSSLMTPDEIERVAAVAAGLGVTSIRLTGGEPLLRRDLVDVVQRLSALRSGGQPLEVTLTTNGIGLPARLDELWAAGLSRVNISIDTLRRERFLELTKRDRLADVLEGIHAAAASGRPLKLNAVAMRCVNDDEIVDLVELATSVGAQMRFIEQMPLDAGHVWDRDSMLTREEILEALSRRWDLTPVPGRGAEPAERWWLDGGPHAVGVIASVSAPFCGSCNRLRMTADGQLRSCLFATEELDLMPALRADGPAPSEASGDLAIEAVLRAAVRGKKAGHAIDSPTFLQPIRGMNAIGG
ncbi:GTP 3',8-cyclase MoaA [Aeromicrobium sp. Leaf350]|uniref:GTP 3',8-cyclase MoaA n=1 Tax=Aeromicrobium sp. Leaf350 TaxID=2876565 RepID=UPI001E3306D3|nr:GTP 3',8-cyclase MoaA [Aeromicrobium sp. Leaf350]